jgi:glycosyltransferase involved in cell wall biosynthesis
MPLQGLCVRILLFSRSLNNGGAERQVALLARLLHSRGVPVAVMVLYGDGYYRAELDAAGVAVIDLGKSARWDLSGCFWRQYRAIRRFRPDIVYAFIGMAAFALVTRLFGAPGKVVWGIRASDMDMTLYDWLSRTTASLDPWIARFVDAIICNSAAGRTHVIARDFPAKRIAVVPNGFDLVKWQFDQAGRQRQRAVWGVGKGETLLGMVARIDPIKDHRGFLLASAQACARDPRLRFVCVGGGEPAMSAALQALAGELGLADRMIWAGQCDSVIDAYSALDVLVVSSLSEGFPNVIGEGMAFGLPVVATDVGDCREIVDGLGWLVPARDPRELSEAMLAAADAVANWDREKPRLRIAGRYSIEAMVDQTLAVFERVKAGADVRGA